MTKSSAAQASLFLEPRHAIWIEAPSTLDPANVRLAILVYVGAESFRAICRTGELDFDSWSKRVKDRLVDQQIETTEDELQWLQDHLSYEPKLKACIQAARERLNARLAAEPVLPAGASIAFFLNSNIKEDVGVLNPDESKGPTALITLTEPLHFECHRGAIFQIRESLVVARMKTCAIPGWTGNPREEVRFFVLESEADFSLQGEWVSLRYPSLNKVVPGIFSRLHLNEGKQNSNRSVYYHAAWATQDAAGRPEYHSLWSIRDAVRQRTWKCPPPVDEPNLVPFR